MDALVRPLALYAVQILVVVATAGIGATLFRPLAPRIRLAYWRLVVCGCLLLILLPPRVVSVEVPTRAVSVALVDPASIAVPVETNAPRWPSLVVLVLGAGIAARLLWLGIGFARLRAMRRQGTAAALDSDLSILRRTIAPDADVRWHDAIDQPVTFGVRRPAILLPSRLGLLEVELQRAVLCHELLHASRRDWLATVVEEIARSLLWFHPAFWWAISRIQLSREETVDALTVAITHSRKHYMQALLAFADGPTAVPAPGFVRRRQLSMRIRQLSKEITMSRTHVAFAIATASALIIGSSWTVVSAFPMRTDVRYRAVSEPTAAAVVGRATDGAQASPPPAPVDTQRGRITPPPRPVIAQLPDARPRIESVDAQYPIEAAGKGITAHVKVRFTIADDGGVIDVKATEWSLAIDREISDPNYWANKPQRPFLEAAETAARRWRFAPNDPRSTVDIWFAFSEKSSSPAAAPVVGNVRRIVRIGGTIRPPIKIRDVKPAYPDDARAARVQGVVIIEVTLGVDGSVVDTYVLRSVPMLDAAALEAVRQWRFAPTVLDGEPVEAIMTVTVNFTLDQ